jgi:hypothetical protein
MHTWRSLLIRLAPAATLLLAAGCVTENVSVSAQAMELQAPALRQDGHATVRAVPDGTYDVDATRVVHAEFEEKHAWGLVTRTTARDLTVAELVANCDLPAGQTPAGPCLADQTTTNVFPMGTSTHPRWSTITVIAGLIVSAAAVGVLSYCSGGSVCGNGTTGSDRRELDALSGIAILGGVVVVAGLLYSLATQ